MLRAVVFGLTAFIATAFELDCTSRSDANYAIGCSNTFGSCVAGVGYEFTCPMALKFNPEKDQCDYDHNVEICRDPVGNMGRIIKARSFSCQGRPDGVYEKSECSPYFYYCTHGARVTRLCRFGTYFNPAKSVCDFVHNVDGCRSYRRYPIRYSVRMNKARHSINCAEKVDGLYATGPCSNVYYQCANGISYRKECLGSLKFNRQKMRCDYETEIAGCTNQPAYFPRPMQWQQQPVPEFSCHGKPGGKHAERKGACTGHFWMCTDGIPHKYNCPTGLFYNEHSGQCDFRPDVAACRGAAADTATDPVFDGATVDCHGKEDGFYEFAPCMERFYQCSGGFITHQICPKGLVFNLVNGVCDYRQHCYRQAYDSPGPERWPKTDCSVTGDGVYANGYCLRSFTMCANGLSYAQQCPSHLVYNPHIQACDLPERCLRSPLFGYRADGGKIQQRAEQPKK